MKKENKWNKKEQFDASFMLQQEGNLTRGTKANSLKINRDKTRDFTASFEHEQLLVARGCPI